MLVNGGELDGVRILGRKTIELMTCNHLPNDDDLTRWALGSFSETANDGYGFGLGFSINLGPGRTATIGSKGEYAWGGAASTIFWVDPAEELVVILMTQFMPSRDVQLPRPTENVGVSGDRRLTRPSISQARATS